MATETGLRKKKPPMVEYDLKSFRTRCGLTKADLYTKWGITPPTLDRWERTMMVTPLVKMCALLLEHYILDKRKQQP